MQASWSHVATEALIHVEGVAENCEPLCEAIAGSRALPTADNARCLLQACYPVRLLTQLLLL